MFFQNNSEIRNTWSTNSSKEKIILLHDSEELFVQRYN